jgi:DNA-binding NarL/FixJ family response regulator
VDPGVNALRVVLADDHHIFREGLRGSLSDNGMVVVGDAADGNEAIALASRLVPDIVVSDLSMRGTSGIEVVRRIKASDPDIPVIILTVSADAPSVLGALSAGACGYLLKDTAVGGIVSGIRSAAGGQTVIAAEVMDLLMTRVRASERSTGAGTRKPEIGLTARELEVLKLIARGADNAAIGTELSISRHTVKRYVTNIFEKLGVRSRVEAAVYAVRTELV